MTFRYLAQDVYQFTDCCHVYVVRHADRATVIDAGAGRVADHLAELGVRRVDMVLVTHPHRDQVQGLARLAGEGTEFRGPVEPSGLYPDFHAKIRQDGPAVQRGVHPHVNLMPLPASVPVAPALCAGLAWDFGPFHVEVVALPCHAPGMVGLRVSRGHDRLLFCGDLIHSPGHVHECHHLDTDHHTGRGMRLAAQAMEAMAGTGLTMLCPSHGDVMQTDVDGALWETARQVRRLGDCNDRICPPDVPVTVCPAQPIGDGRILQLTEHVFRLAPPHINTYLIRSDSGKTLLWDPFIHDLYRDQIRSILRDERIEVTMPSHYHDDHVWGSHVLRDDWGAALWVEEHMADSVAHPLRYKRPFSPIAGTPVDRVLSDGEVVRWHEHEFRMHWMPGQTDLHCGLEAEIDGQRILFSGDSFQPPWQWGGFGGFCAYNGSTPEGYRRSIRTLLDIHPDWMFAGHGFSYSFNPDQFRQALEWTHEMEAALAAVSPDGNWRRHFTPHVVRVYPYRESVRPGESLAVTVEIDHVSVSDGPVDVHITPVVPAGWTVEPTCVCLQAHRAGPVAGQFTIGVPADHAEPGHFLVPLDVQYGDEYWGQYAELWVHVATR